MNIFYTIGSFFRRHRSSLGPDPTRDWLTMLIFAAILLAGIVVWNAWAFDTIARGGVIGVSSAKAPAAVTSDSLNTIRTIFSNRAVEEAKYRTGVYSYADPSQ